METDRFECEYGSSAAAINALLEEGDAFTEESILQALHEMTMERIKPHVYSLYRFKKIIGKDEDGSYFLKKGWESALAKWHELPPEDRWRVME